MTALLGLLSAPPVDWSTFTLDEPLPCPTCDGAGFYDAGIVCHRCGDDASPSVKGSGLALKGTDLILGVTEAEPKYRGGFNTRPWWPAAVLAVGKLGEQWDTVLPEFTGYDRWRVSVTDLRVLPAPITEWCVRAFGPDDRVEDLYEPTKSVSSLPAGVSIAPVGLEEAVTG